MIVVVATILFKEEHLTQGKQEIEALLAPTRKEDGCIQYDLHQNIAKPTEFVFYERWESSEALQIHGKSEHILKYKAATAALLAQDTKVEIYHLL